MSNPTVRYSRRTPTRRPRPDFGGCIGYVTCSYDELVKCFGKPTYVAGQRERVKVAMEWKLEDHVTGNLFAVYEWRSTTRSSDSKAALSLAALRRKPEFEWNIAAGRFDLDALQRWMGEQLGREVKFRR